MSSVQNQEIIEVAERIHELSEKEPEQIGLPALSEEEMTELIELGGLLASMILEQLRGAGNSNE